MGDPVVTLKVGKGVPRDSMAGGESLMTLPVGLAFGVAA